ncbi:hypothetical protein GCM10009716_17190 [Streptomyces sodiiphilus]|uniref:YCII-related domain-containing protein n=1 Tax=Streptomyces sodiiphilus TaxID=226217 RepID=A0ABN2P072_9ACTN
MKYLMMVQAAQADYDAMGGRASGHSPAWNEKELRAMFAFMEELNDELTDSGELVDTRALVEPARTRLVDLGPDGRARIAEDPYGPTEVVMAGYWVLDCESPERVTEIAERVLRCPVPEGSPEYPVVIRPIDTGRPDE